MIFPLRTNSEPSVRSSTLKSMLDSLCEEEHERKKHARWLARSLLRPRAGGKALERAKVIVYEALFQARARNVKSSDRKVVEEQEPSSVRAVPEENTSTVRGSLVPTSSQRYHISTNDGDEPINFRQELMDGQLGSMLDHHRDHLLHSVFKATR